MNYAKLACGPHQLRVLACESAFERLRGLLGRPEPEPGVALLLDPCWAVHTVGMRYPIDVVFCDARWRVLRVVAALPPRRCVLVRGATRVLELSAHTARPLGLIVGVRLEPDARLRAERSTRGALDSTRPLLSPPVRALAGLAALTLVATLLLGACAASSPPRACDAPACSVAGASPSPSAAARATAARTPPGSTAALTPRRLPVPDPLAELRLQTEIDYASRAWSLAESGLRRLVASEPREPVHWQRLGIVFLRTGRASEAVESLGAATRLGVDDPRTLQNLGLAHLRAAADALRAAAAAPSVGAGPGESDAPQRLQEAARRIDALLPEELRTPTVGPRP